MVFSDSARRMDLVLTNKKPDFKFIYFLKFVAILLITNSHFKPVYDDVLSRFAFGGAMGCALFFFCSGYTLASGSFTSFGPWLLKRIFRIYPTLWIINLLEAAVTGKAIPWQNYLFPLDPHYWFLQAILCFYVVFYVVMKYAKTHIMLVVLSLTFPFFLTYFLSYNNEWMIDYAVHPYRLHWYYYFAMMLVGAYCRVSSPPHLLKNRNKMVLLSLAMLFFVSSYGLKFLVEESAWNVSPHLQLLFPIGVFAFTLTMLELSTSLVYDGVFDKLNRFFAGLTLEIYVIQFMVIDLCAGLSFPLRFFITVLIIVLSAWLLNKTVSLVIKPIKKAIQ